jgi:multiple antibiotic resistance protein
MGDRGVEVELVGPRERLDRARQRDRHVPVVAEQLGQVVRQVDVVVDDEDAGRLAGGRHRIRRERAVADEPSRERYRTRTDAGRAYVFPTSSDGMDHVPPAGSEDRPAGRSARALDRHAAVPAPGGGSRLAHRGRGRDKRPVLGDVLASAALLFVLLNPFMMTVYLLELVRGLALRELTGVMLRATAISGVVFVGFALTGDRVFEDVLGIRFASFLIFGGTVFGLIALRSIVFGARLMNEVRGEPSRIAGTVAMPFMIGPGTVSASVFAGARLSAGLAILAIALALVGSMAGILALKKLHDVVQERNAALVERYVDIVGRITALVIGTIAVDLVARGIKLWVAE